MRLAKDKTGELVDVADAMTGVNYYCIDCSAALFPKNKKKNDRKRDIHFSHYSDCPGSLETYLHKIAKAIIDRERRIVLPVMGETRIISLEIEKRWEAIIPDIFITDSENKEIIIEIFVTHPTGREKINKIRSTGKRAFEIDLSGLEYNSPLESVREIVIESLLYKKDLSPPTLRERKNAAWPVVIFLAVVAWGLYQVNKLTKTRR